MALVHRILGRKNGRRNTFSARFYDERFDEGEYISIVSKKFETEHHEVYVDSDSFFSELENVFYYQEEPFGSASIIAQWNVMKLASSKGVRVMLDGQGADETLAGYHHYYYVLLRQLLKKDKNGFKQILKKIREIDAEINFSLKDYLLMRGRGIYEFMRNIKYLFDNSNGINRDFFNEFYYPKVEKNFFPFFDDLNKKLYYDTFIYGLENLLRYADRNSMAHAVEIRLPFLYHKLVEFIFSLPWNMKIYDGWTKYILRKAIENILPDEIVWRKDKMGYQAPQNSWLKLKQGKELVEESKNFLIEHGYITEKYNNKWNIIMTAMLLRWKIKK